MDWLRHVPWRNLDSFPCGLLLQPQAKWLSPPHLKQWWQWSPFPAVLQAGHPFVLSPLHCLVLPCLFGGRRTSSWREDTLAWSIFIPSMISLISEVELDMLVLSGSSTLTAGALAFWPCFSSLFSSRFSTVARFSRNSLSEACVMSFILFARALTVWSLLVRRCLLKIRY